LLYEIGVRSAFRRRGIGRALLDVMETWMKQDQIAEVWVLADTSIAVDFYRGCGMEIDSEQPVYMTKDIS
jgi:ribosomal protein S18 acetylase RimI-like enzyme